MARVETQCREREGFQGVDILLTSEWPKGVGNNLAQPLVCAVSEHVSNVCGVLDLLSSYFYFKEGFDLKVGAQPISRLAYFLKPRYHFSSLYEHFYERIPYR